MFTPLDLALFLAKKLLMRIIRFELFFDGMLVVVVVMMIMKMIIMKKIIAEMGLVA